jgi:TPR repeat protein
VTPNAQPWERWPTEPDAAYAAFAQYLHLGWPTGTSGPPSPRLLPTLARRTGHDSTWLRDLLHTWHWRDRALAYDAAVRRSQDAAAFDHAYDGTRHILAMIDQSLAAVQNELDKALERTLSGDVELPLDKAIAALEKAAKLKQLLGGKPTEIAQVQVQGAGLGDLSDDELETLSDLLARVDRTA